MKFLDDLTEERATLASSMETVIENAANESRDLTETEDANLKEMKERSDVIDARVSELHAIQLANAEAAKTRAQISAVGTTEEAPVGRVHVTDEPLTYAQESKTSFFQDLYRSQFHNDPASRERITRHQQEMDVEHRDGSTSNYAGLVVPQYLTQLAAELSRAGRPFADQCTSLPLPSDGMTINVSRITTGSSAAAQASENAAISETDIDDTLLTADVRTIAAGQQVSRQAIERGSGIDQLIAADMAGAVAVVLEDQVLNGSGSSGNMLGLSNISGKNAITYTDASPTAAEAFSKLVDGIQQINSNRFAGADLIVMHPRRLAWFQAATDSSGRPLVVPQQNVPSNSMGVGPIAGYGVTGASIAGLPVVTSGKVTTSGGSGGTEDVIFIVRRADMLLFENSGAPAMVRMDQTAGLNLTVTLVAYQYACFVGGRYPAAVSMISGTGLVAPTF